MLALDVSSQWNSNKESDFQEGVEEGESPSSGLVRGDVHHERVGGQEESGVTSGQILETLQQQILNLVGGGEGVSCWYFVLLSVQRTRCC